ncbi:citramalate synthase [Haloimpatiens sp. FM7330]|uniref:citramalate synthase n=1 Tax=Haloimpatiens sp. FM7330 TaxID=3298610 RepID=UPI0036453631
MKNKVYIYDSTLRDGAQAQGISFSVKDKIKIAQKLDEMGVDYIEAGNPSSNSKDMEFFKKVKELNFENSKLCAFGSTRRPNIKVEDDTALKELLKAEVNTVAIFGKTWDFHVTDIIKTTLKENLAMVRESIEYLKSLNKEVIFDAEHFFDGYKSNKEYAILVITEAKDAGADSIVLCDTNGGTIPSEIHEIVSYLVKELKFENLGIHCHNDGGLAVANSLMAVQCGVNQVQGTFNGIGERCGNTNLTTVIANLEFKMNYKTVLEEKLENLTAVSRYISEVSNIIPDDREPYVGAYAFAHKGGMHIDAVKKDSKSFEHLPPETVGNERKILMSEVSGRSTIMPIINKINLNIEKDSQETKRIINKLKKLEHEGYQFEGAESSFELLVRKELGIFKPSFQLIEYKVITDKPSNTCHSALATIKLMVNGVMEVTAEAGNGPVNALDKALRKALSVFYKPISKMYLSDYKVRVISGDKATSAKVRVIIESTDGVSTWNTVGVSHDIIEASWEALVDSVEYLLTNKLEEEK